MSLRLSNAIGDRVTSMLAASLGFDEAVVDPALFDVAREFAFSATDEHEFRHWYLVSQCFTKFDNGDPSGAGNRARLAYEEFALSEQGCADANGRLIDTWSRARLNRKVWTRARTLCASILGRFPWERFPASCGFGPGASSGLPRRRANHQNKWEFSSHITEGAIPFHHAFVKWAGCDLPVPTKLLVVDGNTVTTVPKNWKKDRVIAIEPDWNMFYQKGLGRLIRSRLQRWGQLHPDAQSKSRALARLGSWTGSLATLDMSRASDSVSLALCEALLPHDWFNVVMALRSPKGLANGVSYTYEKVSSMGNGATFELETLIFYVLVLAASSKEYWDTSTVYGDDIVCSTHCAEDIISVLVEAGFSVNADKSFWAGPFRESCGGHYWLGKDVTPFYLKHHPESVGDLTVLGNHIYTWLVAQGSTSYGQFSDLMREVRRAVPRALRGPVGLGGCLWSNWDECRPSWRRDFQSYRQKIVVRKSTVSDVSDASGAYLHKLWVENDDLEGSKLVKANSSWRESVVYLDRESWTMLTVR